MKVLGVLGGMGPAATVDFLTKLQAATPATTTIVPTSTASTVVSSKANRKSRI